ncbi:hypothetical protein [Streptomyces sp. HC307]|uniref:hypothetical protein n=1 Tax=Streptomyces flavusporus TaxID=3385496 RepID=UPI0039174AD8
MTARMGEAFDMGRALSDIEALLAEPLPAAGPTTREGAPDTGEWSATRGEGFVLVPLWEGEALTGVYGREWDAVTSKAQEHLVSLAAELDRRWGAHRMVGMHVPLFRKQAGEALPEPFQALSDHDFYGDLAVWGPVTGDSGPRWVGVSLNHYDGDAPMIMTALVADRPITELDEQT